MFRVRVLEAVLASLFISGAYAEQFGGKLVAGTSSQPIPKYAFSAGNFSPNYGGSRLTGQAELGMTSPVSLASSAQPYMLVTSSGQTSLSNASSAYGFSGALSVASNDPLRWIDARRAVESYLNKSSYAGEYGLEVKPQLTAPLSTAALLAPTDRLYVAPRGMR
jgi:hypothetical protein